MWGPPLWAPGERPSPYEQEWGLACWPLGITCSGFLLPAPRPPGGCPLLPEHMPSRHGHPHTHFIFISLFLIFSLVSIVHFLVYPNNWGCFDEKGRNQTYLIGLKKKAKRGWDLGTNTTEMSRHSSSLTCGYIQMFKQCHWKAYLCIS